MIRMMSEEKILMVDDDSNALKGYERMLSRDFNLETAICAEDGFRLIENNGPYSVVISDQRMPKIRGVEFLARVRSMAPETVRMMLSGEAEFDEAIDAVNEGNIFRFLKKPCPADLLKKSICIGIEQNRLMTVEKDMVEKTLRGGVSVLSDILSMVSPIAFGRCIRVRDLVRKIALNMNHPNIAQVEIAALLSQIGCVILPEEVLFRAYRGQELSVEEQLMLDEHPKIGASLIAKIPRLEVVAFLVKHQNDRYDQIKEQLENPSEEMIHNMQILKLALDYDNLEVLEKVSGSFAWPILMRRMKRGWYQSQIIMAFKEILERDEQEVKNIAAIKDTSLLDQKMVFLEDLMSLEGELMVGKGYHVTDALRRRLTNIEKKKPIRYPIMVSIDH